MKKNYNILKYKIASPLPRGGGFYSGVCPGAAAITILTSFFSSPWGTSGRNPVSDFPSKGRAGLFLIPYSLFQEKENKEYRIRNVKSGSSGNPKSRTVSIEGRNIPVLRTFGFYWNSSATNITGAPHLGFQTADKVISGIAAEQQNTLSGNQRICRTIIGKTAAAPQNICRNEYRQLERKVQRTEILKENKEYRIRNVKSGSSGNPKSRTVSIEGRNIPVLRTFGFYWNSSATNITGATHLGFQTADKVISGIVAAPQNNLSDNRRICRTIIGETAAAPRNICRNEYSSSGKKVRSTEILKENNEYRIMNGKSGSSGNPKSRTVSIEGRNIPVLRTFGFHWNSSATNITGATHLGFQTAGTAIGETAAAPQNTLLGNQRICRTIIGETAAAPRNICRNEYSSSGKKVRSTEILKENKEHRITLSAAEGLMYLLVVTTDKPGTRNTEPETLNIKPETLNQKTEQPSHTMTSSHSMTVEYKVSPQLPRGGFYTGDLPGAAAITIILLLFSSPRVSPTFAGAKRLAVSQMGTFRANRLARLSNLPVINQTFFSSPWGRPGGALNQKGGPPMI